MAEDDVQARQQDERARMERRKAAADRVRQAGRATSLKVWKRFLPADDKALPYCLNMWDVDRVESNEEGLALLQLRLSKIEANWEKVEGEIKESTARFIAGPQRTCYDYLKKAVPELIKKAKKKERQIQREMKRKRKAEEMEKRRDNKKRKQEATQREASERASEAKGREQRSRIADVTGQRRAAAMLDPPMTICCECKKPKYADPTCTTTTTGRKRKPDSWEWFGCAVANPDVVCTHCASVGHETPVSDCPLCEKCNSWLCGPCQIWWKVKHGREPDDPMANWKCNKNTCGY
jgi:hypothetical protein